MPKFTDEIIIKIRAGHGGAGAVSFRREKYIAKGGPDGGDGGCGGNVHFTGSRSHTNLSYFFKDKLYAAKKGENGHGRNQHGADGEDILIKVPIGTEIIDAETDELLADVTDDEKVYTIAKGGIGGKGNAFFKTSTMQTPRFSQSGEPGDEFQIKLNLKLIADVGFVGLPNAGKSTILSKITAADPKIGDYPFTTLTPNLGVIIDENNKHIKIADIPGIIEGAHMGHGLGLSFLRHIERVKAIMYIIAIDSEDIHSTYALLQDELNSYNSKLKNIPSIIVINKTDLVDFDENYLKSISKEFNTDVLFISAETGYNFELLRSKIFEMVK